MNNKGGYQIINILEEFEPGTDFVYEITDNSIKKWLYSIVLGKSYLMKPILFSLLNAQFLKSIIQIVNQLDEGFINIYFEDVTFSETHSSCHITLYFDKNEDEDYDINLLKKTELNIIDF